MKTPDRSGPVLGRVTRWLLGRLLGPEDARVFESELGQLQERRRERLGKEAASAILRKEILQALFHAFLSRFRHPFPRLNPPASPHRTQPSGVDTLDSLIIDIRFAVRSLRKRPVFLILAVGALGLGIGGTTTMFSVVDGVLIKRLPYGDPGRLVNIWMARQEWHDEEGGERFWNPKTVRVEEYLTFRDRASTLSSVAAFHKAFGDGEPVITGGGMPEALSAFEASANLFGTIGVRPVLGRTFLAEEVGPEGGPSQVAILSHELWTRRFGGNRDILGQAIVLNGIPFEVVGVLPEGFRLPSKPYLNTQNAGTIDAGLRDIWVPLGSSGCFPDCGGFFLELIGRLSDGVSVDQVRAELQSLMRDDDLAETVARVSLSKEIITRGFGTPLTVLLGAAAVLMLIACTNVMGLLIGEGAGRQHELAVRAALGASRGRVVRQLLTESLLLGLLGAVVGLVLAQLGTSALLATAPPLPRLDEIAVSGRVLLFATGTGILTGLLFGVVPALWQTKVSGGSTLRSRGRSRNTRSLQTAVVSAQVGLSVVLIVAGSLFARSFLRLMSVDPGFDSEGLVSLTVTAPPVRTLPWRERGLFYREIFRIVGEVPGVRSVGATSTLPFPGGGSTHTVRLEGNPEQFWANALFRATDPSYVEVMGIPLVRGRVLSEADNEEAPGAMLVSQSLAGQIWRDRSPIGEQVRCNGLDWTVVGVVGDVRQDALGLEVQPAFYVPVTQTNVPPRKVTLVVRTSSDQASTLSAVRHEIWSRYPGVFLGEANTMAGLIRASESDDRFRGILMWTFAIIAGLLSAVGVFGVTARAVWARAKELGIRSALGAEGRDMIRLVLKDGLLGTFLGLVLGFLFAFWASRIIGHLLYQIDARDPWAYLGALVLSVSTFTFASYIPARRVTKIDPMEVLIED